MPVRTYTHFEGGVNKRLGPVVLDNGGDEALFYAEDSTNWWCSDQGLVKYPGYGATLSVALSGNPIITGIFEYKSAASASLELIVCAGTKVYTVSGGTATQIFSGVTAGKYFQAVKWQDTGLKESIILMNGTDTPLVYNGTTCAAITFIDPQSIWGNAKPKFAGVFRGRIFYSGDPTHPWRVYTPRPGTINNFDDNDNSVDAFDVDPGNGGVITGLRALTDDFLVIYKERSIRRLEGSAPFNSGGDQFYIHVVSDAFGCIAARTLCGNDLEHYFLSSDGLRQLKPVQSYGDVDPNIPTYLIQDLINNINFTIGVVDNACAVYDPVNRQVWFSVPDGSNATNNLIYMYSVITKANDYRGTGDITAACLGLFNRGIYHGDYAGQLYQHGLVNGLNGANMTGTWESKYIAHNGIGSFKRYRDMMLYADSDNSGDIIVQWTTIRGGVTQALSNTESINSGSGIWDSGAWDRVVWSTGDQAIFYISNLGRGQAIKLKFTNISSTQRPKIRQVDLSYDLFSRVKG